jgi:hypothetical protein
MRPYLPRSAASVAALAAAAGLVTGGIAAPAGAVTPNPSPSLNLLNGVSAVSGTDAWAVGIYNNATTSAAETLVLHWNGTAWRQVKSPSPSSLYSELDGVSAVSGSDAWAVGSYWNVITRVWDTLILHWNGTAWTRANSPNPGLTSSQLYGVSAVSGSDAWAVGSYDTSKGGVTNTLILHWNGTAWTQVNSPNPSSVSYNSLDGVGAVSASDAWAVGDYGTGDSGRSFTLILHWDGTAWSTVSSPSPGSGVNSLRAVSAVSGGDAWAVGSSNSYDNPYVIDTMILHWDGTAWTHVQSPSPSSVSYNYLKAISARSGSDAWAVGYYNATEIGPIDTMILHWNGTAWTKVKSPNPSCPNDINSYNDLYGVSARTGSDAWAVGDYGDCATNLFKRATLVAHWNGRTWVNASAIKTVTSVSSSANPVTTGKPVTYTATVAPTPTPNGGTVAFYDNGSLISLCRHQAVSSGRATCRVTYAAAGSHTIKAKYSGYADYARSTSPPLTETVKTPATA